MGVLDPETWKWFFPAAVGTVLIVAAAAGIAFAVHNHDENTGWENDTADRLSEYGGSVYLTDGSYIVIYAHIKPTTGVEYKNDAFYITDPNNTHTGLIIVPLDKVTKVYTGAGA